MDFGAQPMSAEPLPIGVLFVCSGNICRSPALEACFQKLVFEKGLANQFYIDSCGLSPYHLGCSTDARMKKAGEKRGISFPSHQVKLFENVYFKVFHYILAVEKEMVQLLQSLTESPEERAKVHLACAFSHTHPFEDLPDPYYDGEKGFDHVIDIAEDICNGLLDHILKSYPLK
jgi:protein-tyrosine phosphatase